MLIVVVASGVVPVGTDIAVASGVPGLVLSLLLLLCEVRFFLALFELQLAFFFFFVVLGFGVEEYAFARSAPFFQRLIASNLADLRSEISFLIERFKLATDAVVEGESDSSQAVSVGLSERSIIFCIATFKADCTVGQ